MVDSTAEEKSEQEQNEDSDTITQVKNTQLLIVLKMTSNRFDMERYCLLTK